MSISNEMHYVRQAVRRVEDLTPRSETDQRAKATLDALAAIVQALAAIEREMKS